MDKNEVGIGAFFDQAESDSTIGRRQFPISGLWLVGTLVGIRLLFNGLTTVTLAGAARGRP